MRVMIIPGNGNTDISENWFPYVKRELEKIGARVIAENMPDPDIARRKFWIPFMEKKINGDETAIVIGHSSGAVAIMRYLEKHKLQGAILVGACYTDLGSEKEKDSEYYKDPWNWDKIKSNAGWIAQFASQDDPFIPIKEARHIHEKLKTEYYEYNDQGHMGGDVNKTEFPEIIKIIKKKVSLL